MPHPQAGGAYTGLSGPNRAVQQVKDSSLKTGESCATVVLGSVAWGDASIAAARNAGKISKISAVDYKIFSILRNYMVYHKTCTLVTGT